MDNIKKNPDKKLYIGAKIGLIANIINIIWSIIIAIILIAASDVILKFIQKKGSNRSTTRCKHIVHCGTSYWSLNCNRTFSYNNYLM